MCNKSVGVTPFYLRGELVTPTKMLSVCRYFNRVEESIKIREAKTHFTSQMTVLTVADKHVVGKFVLEKKEMKVQKIALLLVLL